MLKNVLLSWELDDVWLEQAERLAKGKDLVTLDIFDTALTRDVDSPIDIFAKVEFALSDQDVAATGFARARQWAEQKARDAAFKTRGLKEIILDEIYAELPHFLPLSAQQIELARNLELQFERNSLFAVPDIMELTRRLNQNGIPYAFVSDMYLGKDILAPVLEQAGYQNWQALIVSCDYRRTKSDGAIWTIAPLRGQHILHIGDNEHSDVAMPRKHPAIDTLLYARAGSHVRAMDHPTLQRPHYLPFSRQHRLTQMAWRADPRCHQAPDADERRLYALGESFGALICGSFILWLVERARANDITHLAFCARDGYLMREAWQILGDPAIGDSYLHVSRKVLTLSSSFLELESDFMPEHLLNFLSNYQNPPTPKQILANIGLEGEGVLNKARQYFGSLDRPIKDKKKIKQFLQRYPYYLRVAFKHHYENICGYLRQQAIFDHQKLAVVDLGWNGTLQRGLTQIGLSVDKNFQAMGFYYGLWNSASGNRFLAGAMESLFFNEFDPQDIRFFQWQGVDMLEELHSSHEGTTTGYQQIDGRFQPVVAQNAQEKCQYEKLIAPFQRGVCDALRGLKESGHYKCLSYQDLTVENALAAYHALFISPTRDDMSALANIAHGTTFDHILMPIIKRTHPKDVRQCRCLMRGCNWQMGQLKYWFSQDDDRSRMIIRDFIQNRFSHLTPQQIHSLEKD